MKGGSDKMLKYSKSGRFLGFVRVVLRRDATGRPVETAPFARRREAPLRQSGEWWKAAIALGVAMAESEARRMLAMKARQVRLSSPRSEPDRGSEGA